MPNILIKNSFRRRYTEFFFSAPYEVKGSERQASKRIVSFMVKYKFDTVSEKSVVVKTKEFFEIILTPAFYVFYFHMSKCFYGLFFGDVDG